MTPMSGRRTPRVIGRRTAVVAAVATVVAGALVASATGTGEIAGSASATDTADRDLPESVDVVTLHDSGPLDRATKDRAINAANIAGASWRVVSTASSAMTRLSRGGFTVQAAAPDFSYPMSTTFLPDDLIATLMGADVLTGLSDRTLVMSSGTAALRGAQAGDVVTLRHVFGGTRDFTITQIVDDAITGGTELLMLPSAASRLGVDRESRVMIWGFDSRESIMQALAAADAVANASVGPGAIHDPVGTARPIRLRRSWDPRDPDGTLGMAAMKIALGEFTYRVNPGSDWVTVDSAWTSANLPSSRVSLGIGIVARCHRVLEPQLRAAFAEVAARGLSGAIDVNNANSAGGCFGPRFNRLSPNSSVGFLSRHTWAAAIDLNTIRDCQGCDPPSMAVRPGGCDVVRIMRAVGFSWGGNYTTPDGMHFEYVGEDRSQIPYPSRYCPNLVSGSALNDELPLELTERSVLFADAGLIDGHSHD